MLGHGAIGQFAIGESGPGTAVVWGWFTPFADPALRLQRQLTASEQTFFAAPPAIIAPWGWLEPLAEPPIKTKRGVPAAEQQFVAFHPAPSPFVAPGWFSPLSEPVRFKPGLRASLQRELAWPPRLLPTPTITGTLFATDTPDIFFAGGARFNAVISADVGVIELATRQISGIIEAGTSPPVSGVIEQGLSVTSGNAVASIAMGIVSIRQI